MAMKTQPIIEDLGSDLQEELLKQFNLLLDQIDALGGGATATDLQLAVQANVKKVSRTKNLPRYKHFPVK